MLLDSVAAWSIGRDPISVVDLGCGTGSTLRSCALDLAASRQRWRLVDSDPVLLAAARERLSSWAESSEHHGDELRLVKGGKSIEVLFAPERLSAGLECVSIGPVDLVTASALFDLVSPEWIDSWVATLAERSLPLYAALTYDGREEWSPGHPHDAVVHRAFLAHQRHDKGFGPAAGPDAAHLLARALQCRGYHLEIADSTWQLGSGDGELIEQLAAGIADAAGAVRSATAPADDWRRFRRDVAASADSRVMIGHRDVWAHP